MAVDTKLPDPLPLAAYPFYLAASEGGQGLAFLPRGQALGPTLSSEAGEQAGQQVQLAHLCPFEGAAL